MLLVLSPCIAKNSFPPDAFTTGPRTYNDAEERERARLPGPCTYQVRVPWETKPIQDTRMQHGFPLDQDRFHCYLILLYTNTNNMMYLLSPYIATAPSCFTTSMFVAPPAPPPFFAL